jgi:hypothetical protein
MTKHGRSKRRKGKAKSDQNKTDTERQTTVNPMSDTPNKKPPDLHETKSSNKDEPPTPSEFLILVADWLRSRKNAPREKSKTADWVIAALTIGIAIAAFWSAFVFQGQLEEARRQTEISERPWLSVEIEPAEGLIFTNTQQAAISLKLSIKNVGKSIAKGIQVEAKLFPSDPSLPPIVAVDSLDNQKSFCDHPKISPIGTFDLFPTERPLDQTISIHTEESSITSKATVIPGKKPRSFVGLYFVGCVTYFSSFAVKGHQTRFSYHLQGPLVTQPDGKMLTLPDGMALMGGFEVGVRVPKEQLGLMRDLLSMNDAN